MALQINAQIHCFKAFLSPWDVIKRNQPKITAQVQITAKDHQGKN